MKMPKDAPARWAQNHDAFGEGWGLEFDYPDAAKDPAGYIACRAAELQHAYTSNWKDEARRQYQEDVRGVERWHAWEPSHDDIDLQWMSEQIPGLSYDMLYAVLKGYIWLTQVHIEAVGSRFGRETAL